MTDDELKEHIIDYFEAYELVDLLNLTTEEVVEAFLDKIEENSEFLEDYMKYGR